jgi:hypothetical protein
VTARAPFGGMRVSVYPVDAQQHPKLSLRYKPQLVQLQVRPLNPWLLYIFVRFFTRLLPL